jgi:cytochrome c oxidase subunit I+III
VLIGGFVFPMLAAAVLLDAADHRPAAVHRLGEAGVLADLRRLQRHLLHHAPDRAAGHAAADLHLSRGWLAIQAAALICAGAALAVTFLQLPDPRAHAYSAASFVLLAYVALHVFVGLLFLTSTALRLRSGHIAPRRSLDLRLTRLWLDYTLATGLAAIGIVLILPQLTSVLP